MRLPVGADSPLFGGARPVARHVPHLPLLLHKKRNRGGNRGERGRAAWAGRAALSRHMPNAVARGTGAAFAGYAPRPAAGYDDGGRSEEHTSELQSLMRISYALFCLQKKNNTYPTLKSTTAS